MRWMGWWAALLWLVAAPVVAQDTGGSFGGGDWGGGGGSDWGGGGGSDWGGGGSDWGSSDTGSSDWGSSDSSDWGSSSDDDYGSSGGGGGGGGGFCALLFIGVFMAGCVGFVVLSDRVRSGSTSYRVPPAPAPTRVWNGIDVACIRLGLDWRARRVVQERLNELARSGRTATKEGRAELLRETVRLLQGSRLAWLYADVVNHRPMSQGQAQGTFQVLATDARARFSKELVRESDGTRTEGEAGPLRAHPTEGPGVVVVTLIVAARRELLDVAVESNAGEVTGLLDDLSAVAADALVALEVVWSPAAEDDRMSTAELEVRYPEMTRFEERTIGGRVFCLHCQGPFADELAACPHCGAPHARGETVPPA